MIHTRKRTDKMHGEYLCQIGKSVEVHVKKRQAMYNFLRPRNSPKMNITNLPSK